MMGGGKIPALLLIVLECFLNGSSSHAQGVECDPTQQLVT